MQITRLAPLDNPQTLIANKLIVCFMECIQSLLPIVLGLIEHWELIIKTNSVNRTEVGTNLHKFDAIIEK